MTRSRVESSFSSRMGSRPRANSIRLSRHISLPNTASRIYTIGAGNETNPIFPVTNPRTGQVQYQRAGNLSLDEDVLREMAQITGGRYFRARDLASLKEIYDSIDELERSEIHQQQYMQYEDMAVEPVRLGGFPLPCSC